MADWSDLLAAAACVAADPRIAPLLDDPKVSDADLVSLMIEAAGGKAGQAGGNLLRLLAENGRLAVLPEIQSQFEALRADMEQVVDVEVVTAMEMAVDQRDRLQAALQALTGRKVRMHDRIDPSLIGGAVVHAGDLVIDGSLAGRLDKLRTALVAQ